MKANEALLLSGHQDPIMLKTRGFYQNHTLKKRSKITAAPLPQTPNGNVVFVPL